MKVRFGQSGLHFYSRETGLNVLLDELRLPRNLWSLAPRHVSIALTNACDLHCAFCFAPKEYASLPVDRVMAWADELDANGCLGVGLGGGEPTLYPFLVELAEYLSTRTKLAVTLTTHGLNFDHLPADKLCGHIHFARVSMDGVGETYEKLREQPFTTLCECLRVISLRFRFGVNYLVNSATISDLSAAAELASGLGASEILLLPERRTRGADGVDLKTSEALRRWIDGYRGSLHICVSEPPIDGLPVCDPLPNERGLISYAHIDASGSVRRSSFHSQGVAIDSTGVVEALRRLGES
ncbi:MAG: radical SAM protein [Spirochaetia bacterium]|jgi:MoaA/NifB/PqqE/SkfB family radical SAM enzyme